MSEREDLLSRLRSVDEVLAGARPRAAQEAKLLARLRAADRAGQPSSSSSTPALLLAVRRAWRPLGVTGGLCAALALALALHAGNQAQRTVEASTSRANGNEDASRDRDRDPTTTRLSSTTSPPRPRAEGPRRRTTPSEERGEREPTRTAPAPELPEAAEWTAPPRAAPWSRELPTPSPRLSSRDDPQPLRDAWTPARDPRLSSAGPQSAPALGGLDAPRVLWAEAHAEAAPKPGASPAPRGQTTSPMSGPPASGCEPAESLVDRARADCESQALTLAGRGLAYLDACGEGQFRGLDYACTPPSAPPSRPPSSKAPAGCISEALPADGTCKTEEDTHLEALHWCEEAGLTLGGLTLDHGACSDGFQQAYLLCCEKDSEDSSAEALPRQRPACTDEDDPDCTK